MSLKYVFQLILLLSTVFGISVTCRSQTVLPKPSGVFVAGGTVLASGKQSDGKVVVGGRFNAINGVPRKNLARLNTDGSVDMSWDPGADSDLFYNPGVFAVKVHGDVVYVGGNFTFSGGQPRVFVAAIDGVTGLATPWDPGTSNAGFVNALEISDDGSTVYVGGYFSNMGGASRSNVAAVSAADGGALSAWNPGIDGAVYALAVAGGDLIVGGTFQTVGGQPRHYLADIDAMTGTVSTWAPEADNTTYALALSGSTLYAGGDFFNVSGQPRNGAAALDVGAHSVTNWNPPISFSAHAIAISESTIYLGGGPRPFSGNQNPGNLVAADATTAALQSWNPNPDNIVDSLTASGGSLFVGGQLLHVGGNLTGGFAVVDSVTGISVPRQLAQGSGTISSLQTQPDGKVIVGGTFTSIADVPRNNLGRLNVNGSVDTAWDPNPDGQITAMLVSNNLVYVAGNFLNIGTHFRRRLAALDLDTSVATNWQPDPDDLVKAIAISGSTVYLGGDFQYIGNSMRSRIAALDASTGLSTSWNPTADGEVLSLGWVGNAVYAGGNFTSIGGQQRRFLAAIDSTSGAAIAWDPSPDATVSVLLPTSNTLYVGGNFGNIGTTHRQAIAAIDIVSGQATNWHSDFAYEGGAVSALALLGNDLVVGGLFYTMGGQPRQHLAVLDTSLGAATPWNAPVYSNSSFPQNPVTALAGSGDHLFLGGNFSSVSTVSRGSLAGVSSPDVIFADGFE